MKTWDTACGHTPNAVCFLCSDARPWWRQARIDTKLGGDGPPPNSAAGIARAQEIARIERRRAGYMSNRCVDCGASCWRYALRCRRCTNNQPTQIEAATAGKRAAATRRAAVRRAPLGVRFAPREPVTA